MSGEDAAHREAARVRKAKLTKLRLVVKHCTCLWPLMVYRNGHGHDPECPAVEAAQMNPRLGQFGSNGRAE